jgi:hypothetical protein
MWLANIIDAFRRPGGWRGPAVAAVFTLLAGLPGFLAMPAASGGALYPTTVLNDSTVNLVVTQVGCGAANTFTSQMGSNALQAVQFNVAATATVNRGGRSTVHQGTEALAPPGSC